MQLTLKVEGYEPGKVGELYKETDFPLEPLEGTPPANPFSTCEFQNF